MQRWTLALGGSLMVATLLVAQTGTDKGTSRNVDEKKLALYLTREGKLTSPVEVVEEWKNIIASVLTTEGFPSVPLAATTYRVSIDGQWTIQNLWQNRVITQDYRPNALQLRRVLQSAVGWTPNPEQSGQLGPQQIKELAMVLAQNDLLEVRTGGLDTRVNHHFLTVRFGGRSVTITMGVDQQPGTIPVRQPGEGGAFRLQAVLAAIKNAIAQGSGGAPPTSTFSGSQPQSGSFFTPRK